MMDLLHKPFFVFGCGTAQQKEFTRFLSGQEMARIWGHSLKVAAVWKAELINKFAENVAVNRGACFAVFSDQNADREWLMQGANKTLESDK